MYNAFPENSHEHFVSRNIVMIVLFLHSIYG